MVSSIETIVPGTPVNCSATAKGCDKNVSIRRARFTNVRSASESSSIPKDRDNILQLLVALENLLYALGYFVMLLTNDMRVENTRGGLQRVDSRIDAKFGNLTAQYRCCIQVRESSGGCRVGSGHRQEHNTACTEVMEPLRVEVMRSCIAPISVASVG